MRLRYLKIISLLLIVGVYAAMPGVVLAIGNPDSTPSVSNVKANRYLLEGGDMLIYGDYDIPYASLPTEPADDTYIFRLLDTDGTTELGAVTPYVLMDKGYNEGCFFFYFTASDNLAWGEPFIIRISQNPAYFASPQNYDYVMSGSAYTSQTTQSANQIELSINVIAMASRLESAHTDYTFTETSAGGTVLSSPTGETYFRGACYGIQAMAASLFLVQVVDEDVTELSWTTASFDNYTDRWSGTWVETDTEATATQFGMTTKLLMSVLFCLPLCIGAIIVSSIKYKKAEPGYVFTFLALIMTALMGWIPAAIFASLNQAMGIYIAYLWFYSRG